MYRYLPPEIGSLRKLQELDLSFNKLKNLPNCIIELSALKFLKVTNNKLVDVPSGISSLRCLESLDLSNNRLTSLGSVKLISMLTLQYLNLQVFSLSIMPLLMSKITCFFFICYIRIVLTSIPLSILVFLLYLFHVVQYNNMYPFKCVENLRTDMLEEVFSPKIKHVLILWGAGGVTCFVLTMLYTYYSIGAIYFISWMLGL